MKIYFIKIIEYLETIKIFTENLLDHVNSKELLNESEINTPEIRELALNLKYFSILIDFLTKMKKDNLDLSIIKQSIEILTKLENNAGLELIYSKLIVFLTKNKNYEEAIIFNKILINSKFR